MLILKQIQSSPDFFHSSTAFSSNNLDMTKKPIYPSPQIHVTYKYTSTKMYCSFLLFPHIIIYFFHTYKKPFTFTTNQVTSTAGEGWPSSVTEVRYQDSCFSSAAAEIKDKRCWCLILSDFQNHTLSSIIKVRWCCQTTSNMWKIQNQFFLGYFWIR